MPALRFAGFTDDWVEKKLGNMAKFSKGSGYTKSDLQDEGSPIILYWRMYTKYQVSVSDVDTYVEQKDNSVISKGGEVIVPASGETAEDIAIAATVEKPGIILGGDLNVIEPSDELNSTFLALGISNGTAHKDMAKRAQGKSIVHLHNSDLKNVIVKYPSVEEQNKIVKTLVNLDTTISLYENKLDNLKTAKKSLLQ